MQVLVRNAIDILLRDTSDRCGSILIKLPRRHCLEISELVTEIRDAVVLEDQPGTQLILRLHDLFLCDAVLRDFPSASVAAASRSASPTPSIAVAEIRYRERMFGRQQPRPDIRGKLRLDQRTVQPGASLRRRRPEA